MKTPIAVLLLATTMVLSGCAVKTVGSFNPSPLSSTANAELVGEASQTTLLGLFAFGDNSIDAAMKQGGMTYVRNIDYKSTNFLYLFSQLTTVAYGSTEQPYRGRPPMTAAPRAEAPAIAPTLQPAAAPLYYVRCASGNYGPAPIDVVGQWLQQNRIPNTSEVRKETSSEWLPILSCVGDSGANTGR